MAYMINQDREGLIKKVKLFALDMDGTLYLGSKWIPGAEDFLKEIESSGRKYTFMTNNSSKGIGTYISKLASMGLDADESEFTTSAKATIWYLKREYPGASVYLMGNASLRNEFLSEGIDVSGEREPEVVVAAFDTELTYEKLFVTCDLVREGKPYIATHPDINCPTETGFIPDLGSMIELISSSAGRRPDIIIGKPNVTMMEYLINASGYSPEEICVVGDRLYTDIAFGEKNGIMSILVLSGESSYEDLLASDNHPDLVFESVKEIIPYL